MKKLIQFLVCTFLLLSFLSCNPDDDNPAPTDPVTLANQFTVGSDNYPLTAGFRSDSFLDSPGLFITSVFLVDDGLTLDTNNEIAGNGNVVGLEFYTASNNGLQAGVYNLDNVNDQALTVYVYIGINYDAQTDTALLEDEIFQGTITVEELSNGSFKITGQGRADDANASFTLNYSGNLQLVN